MSVRVGKLRALPLRVAPLPGEAIDSWLEATAAKHRATFGAVLDQCGIRAGGAYGARLKSRLMAPSQHMIDDIAYVTGTAPELVQTLTLAPVDLRPAPRHQRWEWRVSSRACPHCLTETRGRWMLAWRHNLTFACSKHHCLLLDTCAVCRRPMRSRPHRVRLVPVLGLCANPVWHDVSDTGSLCGADLTAMSIPSLGPHHIVLWAQRQVEVLRSRHPLDLRLYGDTASAVEVLGDVLVLARWMVSTINEADLGHILSTLDANAARNVSFRSEAKFGASLSPTIAPHPSAAHTALGIALALTVLHSSTVQDARNLLQRILDAAPPEWLNSPSARDLRRRLGEPLDAAYQSAFIKIRSQQHQR